VLKRVENEFNSVENEFNSVENVLKIVLQNFHIVVVVSTDFATPEQLCFLPFPKI
jgi:hypothetical protein